MALILNIDTCTENAIVSLANNDVIIGTMNNSNQKDHASFLHTAIKNLLDKSGILISQLNAIAVTAGPGSYTGIRVGMAAAKGLAYALQIPLISLNTLEVIAMCSIIQSENKDAFFCPMIDARRMEVFTAVYDQFLKEIIAPCAM
ncbi:MAG: tRNA (adenosine(37)-N6)-threonylcarbamoyltransferase complex dimerization subunit type 1 TsaB, partial [Chitinophagaceae bacterium]|nr:tRNA (adenosine(37)-N6)-threonylcarbamoyltransferase complex dimerization subunit type 1 TsaB [Chitinophagaceae bacterium]